MATSASVLRMRTLTPACATDRAALPWLSTEEQNFDDVRSSLDPFVDFVGFYGHPHKATKKTKKYVAVGRFPEPGDEELLSGPSRNFQVFDPLDFLAEVTQHIPDRGEHLIRYYGWYSNKSRGQRAQRQPPASAATAAPPRSPTAREARKGWAALIKQVYEADPLCCPKCGSAMKIIAFIERHQTEVTCLRRSRRGRQVEKILRHCGLWEESPARSPPASAERVKA
jgi:hypothetical protein